LTEYIFEGQPAPAEFVRQTGLSEIAAGMLWRRGFRTAEDAAAMYTPNIPAAIAALENLPGAETAAEVISEHADGFCVVYHDYDADGVSAAAIVIDSLCGMGIRAAAYSNLRGGEGYGMSCAGVDDLLERFPDATLIITVDNGIAAVDAVKYAKERGLAVVITDHHEPQQVLPPADATVDPKCIPADDLSAEKLRIFCGASVALGVMLALSAKLGRGRETVLGGLDAAALATIADAVPLTGHNRAIFAAGIERINSGERCAFRALADICGVKGAVTAETISYRYGPMLNAPSRVTGDPTAALELMLARDDNTAAHCASLLDALNRERKELAAAQFAAAQRLLDGADGAAVLYDECFTEGIVGIVAGRVMEMTGRPTAVLARREDGTLRASSRAPEGYSLVDMLGTLAEEGLVESYGGHDRAAGFSADEKNLEMLALRFRELAGGDAAPVKVYCDARLRPHELTADLARELQRFEPFGEGFPPFLIELEGFETGEVRRFGKSYEHVRFIDRNCGLSALIWNGAADIGDILCSGRAFHGALTVDDWRGRVRAEFVAQREQGNCSTLYCKNGETVTFSDCWDDWIEVEYRGKLHKRPLSAVGSTLFTAPPNE